MFGVSLEEWVESQSGLALGLVAVWGLAFLSVFVIARIQARRYWLNLTPLFIAGISSTFLISLAFGILEYCFAFRGTVADPVTMYRDYFPYFVMQALSYVCLGVLMCAIQIWIAAWAVTKRLNRRLAATAAGVLASSR
jgi:hypothetical protein